MVRRVETWVRRHFVLSLIGVLAVVGGAVWWVRPNPLEINPIAVGFEMDPLPGAAPRWVTFGGFLMCSDRRVRLESVTPHWEVAPKHVETWIHTSTRPGKVWGSPVMGRPPLFDEPYAVHELRGPYVDVQAGFEVANACDKKEGAMPGRNTAELMVTALVDPSVGASLVSLTVRYRDDSVHRTYERRESELSLVVRPRRS